MATTGIYSEDIQNAIERIAAELSTAHKDSEGLVIMAIANGGVEIAQRLQKLVSAKLERIIPVGIVDITFHRDDIMLRPITKDSINTAIDVDLDDATVILVDDVLFSGRTARAALNECFDQGRPELIELAVLVDRTPRKLPIFAQYIGIHYQNEALGKLKVSLDSEDASKDMITFEKTL